MLSRPLRMPAGIRLLVVASSASLLAWTACGGGRNDDEDDDSSTSESGAGGSGASTGSSSSMGGGSTPCPATCSSDADCTSCGDANACSAAGRCAQCSATAPCPGSLSCYKGTCVQTCGANGEASCAATADCAGCGSGSGSWFCPPGGMECTAPDPGCSGLSVMPPPYDQVSQLCSNDDNCTSAASSVAYDVRSRIQSFIGSTGIVVENSAVPIVSAAIDIGMNHCGRVPLVGSVQCGVCGACRSDADCGPYPLASLQDQLFGGHPLAADAYAQLVEQMYGQTASPELHFFCLPVTTDLGVCTPCGNITDRCGDL